MELTEIVPVIPLITKITIIYDRGSDNSVNSGTSVITLIFPLNFRVITLVRKLDLFPRNYVGSEIRKSGITRKTE